MIHSNHRKHPDETILKAFRRFGSQVKAAEHLGMSQATVSARLRKMGVRGRRGRNQILHDEAEILRLWQEHRNQHTVGRLLRIRPSAVGKVLRRNGICVGRGKRLPVHTLPMAEVESRYLAGESCREIAASYGVEPEVIRRRLRTKKVADRKSTRLNSSHSQISYAVFC